MNARPAAARAWAPAKINPLLRVLGRRADGYHELLTWMVALELADELCARAVPCGGVRLALSGPAATPDVSADERNLAWRAADAALRTARELGLAGANDGLELELLKRIPSQAGLGGGSSDAAAAWLVAQAALGVELPRERARATLAALGSDTLFFFEAHAGSALCRGRGEQVQPWPAAPAWSVALLTPDVGCPTGEVYRALLAFPITGKAGRVGADPAKAIVPDPGGWQDLGRARAQLCNDLEQPALAAVPALAPWRKLLDSTGASHYRLAGSGCSFFGIFRDGDDARNNLGEVLTAARVLGLATRFSGVFAPARTGVRLTLDS